jgi:hypothetical protein
MTTLPRRCGSTGSTEPSVPDAVCRGAEDDENGSRVEPDLAASPHGARRVHPEGCARGVYGRMAALIVFENTWGEAGVIVPPVGYLAAVRAAPFVSAVMDAGGALIASQRIPAPDVVEALERLEAGHTSLQK